MSTPGDSDGGCIVLVLGMHRSGTSVLTNCMVAAGLRVADDLLAPDPQVNPDGFFEDAKVVALNDRMLAHRGQSWMDYRVPEIGKDDDFILSWRQEVLEHIRTHYPPGAPWVMKDPRLCLTWRYWLNVLDEAGREPRIVHVVRDPAMVVASLKRRDALPPDYCLLLWIAYVLAAANAASDVPRSATLSYDSLVSAPREAIEAVFGGLGLKTASHVDLDNKVRRPGPETSGTVAAQVSEDLWGFAEKVYKTLLAQAEPEGVPARGELVQLWQQWQQLLARNERRWLGLRETARTLQNMSQQLVEIGELHRHAQEVVAERDRQLGERDRQLSEKDRQLGERDHQLSEKDHQLSEKDRQLSERDRQLEELRANWLGRLAMRLVR